MAKVEVRGPAPGKDWVTPVAIVGGAGLLVAGAVLVLKKPAVEGFSNLKVVSYKNTSTGVSAKYPAGLQVNEGDTIEVTYSVDYLGSAVDRYIRAGLWQGNKAIVAQRETPLFMQEATSKQTITATVDIQATGTALFQRLSPDQYGIHLEIRGLSTILELYTDKKPVILGAGGTLTLLQPVVKPASSVVQGTPITITVPIKSSIAQDRAVNVHVSIAEGSILPGPGTEISAFDQAVTIKANSTTSVVVSDTAKGALGTKDVTVSVVYQGQEIAGNNFDDVFKVTQESMTFNILQPSAAPQPVQLGQEVAITCPVKYTAGIANIALRIHVSIFEASILPGPGDFLAEGYSDVTMSPGQTNNAVIRWTTTGAVLPGGLNVQHQGLKDVVVEVRYNGNIVDSNHFDDVFGVAPAGPPPSNQVTVALEQPTISPAQGTIGKTIRVSCPVLGVTGPANSPVAVVVTINESSILPTTGAELARATVNLTTSPGGTAIADIDWVCSGVVGTKDVSVFVYSQNVLIANQHFDDAFNVGKGVEPVESFTIGQPYTNPGHGTWGENIAVYCPVYCTGGVDNALVTVVVLISEASVLPSPGDSLDQQQLDVNLSPGGSVAVEIDWQARGAAGYKDVTVAVWYKNTLMVSNHFDDAFYVQESPSANLTLTIASDPIYAGRVVTNPSKPVYNYGEVVVCQAVSLWPWSFQYWDLDGEYLDNANPINLTMTGNHVLTAHFS